MSSISVKNFTSSIFDDYFGTIFVDGWKVYDPAPYIDNEYQRGTKDGESYIDMFVNGTDRSYFLWKGNIYYREHPSFGIRRIVLNRFTAESWMVSNLGEDGLTSDYSDSWWDGVSKTIKTSRMVGRMDNWLGHAEWSVTERVRDSLILRLLMERKRLRHIPYVLALFLPIIL